MPGFSFLSFILLASLSQMTLSGEGPEVVHIMRDNKLREDYEGEHLLEASTQFCQLHYVAYKFLATKGSL